MRAKRLWVIEARYARGDGRTDWMVAHADAVHGTRGEALTVAAGYRLHARERQIAERRRVPFALYRVKEYTRKAGR